MKNIVFVIYAALLLWSCTPKHLGEISPTSLGDLSDRNSKIGAGVTSASQKIEGVIKNEVLKPSVKVTLRSGADDLKNVLALIKVQDETIKTKQTEIDEKTSIANRAIEERNIFAEKNFELQKTILSRDWTIFYLILSLIFVIGGVVCLFAFRVWLSSIPIIGPLIKQLF